MNLSILDAVLQKAQHVEHFTEADMPLNKAYFTDRLRAINPDFLILHYRLGLGLGYRSVSGGCTPDGEYLHIIEGDAWVREWPGEAAVAASWFYTSPGQRGVRCGSARTSRPTSSATFDRSAAFATWRRSGVFSRSSRAGRVSCSTRPIWRHRLASRCRQSRSG